MLKVLWNSGAAHAQVSVCYFCHIVITRRFRPNCSDATMHIQRFHCLYTYCTTTTVPKPVAIHRFASSSVPFVVCRGARRVSLRWPGVQKMPHKMSSEIRRWKSESKWEGVVELITGSALFWTSVHVLRNCSDEVWKKRTGKIMFSLGEMSGLFLSQCSLWDLTK